MSFPIYPDAPSEIILPNAEGLILVPCEPPLMNAPNDQPFAISLPFKSGKYSPVHQIFFYELYTEQRFHTQDNPGSPYTQWIHHYYSNPAPQRLWSEGGQPYTNYFRQTLSFPSPAPYVSPGITTYFTGQTYYNIQPVFPAADPWEEIGRGNFVYEIEVMNPIQNDTMIVGCWGTNGISVFYQEIAYRSSGLYYVTWPAEKRVGGNVPVLLLPLLSGLAAISVGMPVSPVGRRRKQQTR